IQNLKSKIVFDDHNCEYLLQRRSCETDLRQPRRWHAATYSFIQWQRLRAFERRAALAASAVLSVSPQDAAALAQLDPAVKPHIIFNGIDVASYATYVAGPDHPPSSPNLTQYTGAQSLISNLQSPTLVFTGKMDFRPNIDAMLWFGREVFPLIKPAIPGVQLLIVGQQPSPRLDVLRADTHITLTGWVDDQRPYIARAGVYIAPLRVGGGTRFKLLEAMAMQRAIVSTTLGCEGFDVTSGREMAIADTPAAFADAVIQLLRDEARRADMGCRAHDFVAATYDWSVIVPKLERVYNDMQR
ncbi:MAG: glycosyltransferase, partial [Chloroflexi bacterium]|nr:glycosyltransferase [Chloroflexota bacterium]